MQSVTQRSMTSSQVSEWSWCHHVLTSDNIQSSVLHNSIRMGIRMQERDREVFVMVNYDFEYITEEGKEVWMKEGEILLLLSRTNNDWWQVCLKKHKCLNSSIQTFYWSRIKSGLASCQVFKRQFFNERTLVHLSSVFSNLERAERNN